MVCEISTVIFVLSLPFLFPLAGGAPYAEEHATFPTPPARCFESAPAQLAPYDRICSFFHAVIVIANLTNDEAIEKGWGPQMIEQKYGAKVYSVITATDVMNVIGR